MRKIVLNIDENRYSVLVQFLKSLDYVKMIEASSVSSPSRKAPKRYDFSDLAGKLLWKGDAVSEQRRLRDEW